ncbi:Xpo1-domain-containing protein [Aulographum hederae CBS 113979]|uniref:Exportin-T n=1 Tax=Aulographum hederae CBS 113979 TaxID=1176131 RepID=A0A6G1HFD2_9PEZI|nr:Xpo1-domain-containing protein [Aulographum hederae CBS 113979]
MESQIENAVLIAFDPTADQSFKPQALEFLQQLRADPNGWQACLSLFVQTPRASEIVRHVALEIVNVALQSAHLERQTLVFIKTSFMDYIRESYGLQASQGGVDTPHIQNKLTQTITCLFDSLYASDWLSFFEDFQTLAAAGGNVAATALYFRVLGSIHDEIADLLLARSPEESKRNAELKDLVRHRDAQKISTMWQGILAQWRVLDLNVVEMCLRTVSRWVSWIDISLVVNQPMLSALLEMAGQQGDTLLDSSSPESRIRDAAIDTFSETISKKMQPADKIELIVFLNLTTVVEQLTKSRPLEELRFQSTYDTDLAETVAKLVNVIVLDIVNVLNNSQAPEPARRQADTLIQSFVPHLLRFFGDEFDEVCSTVILSLTELLTFFRQFTKSKEPLPPQYASMLPGILNEVIRKMRYDDAVEGSNDGDDTEEAEFQEFRKRLHVLQQTIAVIDEPLYIDSISRLVASTFQDFDAHTTGLNWRDLDLALYEMHLFGELAVRNGGLFAKRQPTSLAAQRLMEMISKMIESDVASYPHPIIQLQYMETCVRYAQFFEHNIGLIPKVLENFVRLTHVKTNRVQQRAFYLFQRFSRSLKAHFSGDVPQTVIRAIGDLLTIKAELPEDSANDEMSSDEMEPSTDSFFDSQLYLFEAVGCIASGSSVPLQDKIMIAQSVVNPIFADMEASLPAAKNGDERAILQLHHDIMALGTLAKGFTDWSPGVNSGAPPPSEVSEEFVRAAEGVLVALESLKSSMQIRTASRFAFARMIGTLGSRVLQQLPRWIEGLLAQSSNDEMATFLRLLDQVVFAFKTEISGILDTLLSPLLQRVFTGLDQPLTGTDDEIQYNELRREFLGLVLVILNHDLGGVFVSSTNQSIFDTLITALAQYARDPSDISIARLAISVLTRMTVTWGGPTVALPPIDQSTDKPTAPSPSIPGFDAFVLSRFSPLAWGIPTSANFRPRDPQSKAFVIEVAGLQLEILRKTGGAYVEVLRAQLKEMGVGEEGVNEYVENLMRGAVGGEATGTADGQGRKGEAKEKGFRGFLVRFVERARGDS